MTRTKTTDVTVQIRMSNRLLEAIDDARWLRPRSEFLRSLITDALLGRAVLAEDQDRAGAVRKEADGPQTENGKPEGRVVPRRPNVGSSGKALADPVHTSPAAPTRTVRREVTPRPKPERGLSIWRTHRPRRG